MKNETILSTGITQGMHISKITLEPGESTPKHYHKWTTEVYVVLSGKGIICSNDAQFFVSSERSVQIDPLCFHEVINTGEEPLIIFSCKDRSKLFKDYHVKMPS